LLEDQTSGDQTPETTAIHERRVGQVDGDVGVVIFQAGPCGEVAAEQVELTAETDHTTHAVRRLTDREPRVAVVSDRRRPEICRVECAHADLP
jgi:hypothetical protein